MLLQERKNHPNLYKYLLSDETRGDLVNDPKNWSNIYKLFLDQLAPNYQIASSKIGGHFFRFAATNGSVELRVKSLEAWFKLGADFGDLSLAHKTNLSASNRFAADELTEYLNTTNKLFGETILGK